MTWTPVTVRPPEPDARILATTEDEGRLFVDIVHYRDGGFWRNGIRVRVIAWMPTPEAYKNVTQTMRGHCAID